MSDTAKELGTESKTEAAEGFDVIGVSFKPAGKVYVFNINNLDPAPRSQVVVESDMGLSIGLVVKTKYRIEKPGQPLKKVLREASEKDLETNNKNRSFADEARAFCIEKVKTRELPMKIVSTETTLDKKRLIFYFTADGRIDFRELVRDLAARFKTRIEMRQIGVRDEVKLIGGIGSCGRESCCRIFLTSFEPVSIRMAKKQELSISQNKLSGICGRLMCCLGYEYEETDRKSLRPKKTYKMPAVAGKAAPESAAVSGEPKAVSAGEPVKCLCPKKICDADKKEAASASTGNVADEKPERAGQDKPGKPGKDNHGLKSQDKQKKGKPFSKRRKFWKKKKN